MHQNYHMSDGLPISQWAQFVVWTIAQWKCQWKNASFTNNAEKCRTKNEISFQERSTWNIKIVKRTNSKIWINTQKKEHDEQIKHIKKHNKTQ